MADPMHGIEADVPFDDEAADALARTCDAAATAVEGSRAARNTWVTHAMAEFRGHFSTLFKNNATTANGDADELATALRQVATAARRLKEEARKEQQRRETARAWKKERDDRNWVQEKWDDFTGGGDVPPVGPAVDPQILDVPAGRTVPRQNPAPGTGGGSGGGTSSARPADLTSFSTWTTNANPGLRSTMVTARSAYRTFLARCHWGSLAADGVFAGFVGGWRPTTTTATGRGSSPRRSRPPAAAARS